jgi:hypothetical protein
MEETISKVGLARAYKAAHKKHAEVCDVHYDESVMNDDKTCRECQDDLHELEILNR